jgi:hypothetical protein
MMLAMHLPSCCPIWQAASPAKSPTSMAASRMWCPAWVLTKRIQPIRMNANGASAPFFIDAESFPSAIETKAFATMPRQNGPCVVQCALCFATGNALLQHREPLAVTIKPSRLSGVEFQTPSRRKAFVPKSLRFFLAVSLVGVAPLRTQFSSWTNRSQTG